MKIQCGRCIQQYNKSLKLYDEHLTHIDITSEV